MILCLFIDLLLFVPVLVCLLVCVLACLLVYSFVCLLACSFIHCLFVCLLVDLRGVRSCVVRMFLRAFVFLIVR